jgi:hypothetical protein
MATCGAGSVSYATSDGSAKAPADYAATSGTLTFDAQPSGGQHTKTFTVQTAANGTATGSLDFNVALSNPVAPGSEQTTLDTPSSATVTITDGSPTATTAAATQITGSAATLGGTVTPSGRDTSYHFDFGPTDAYGGSSATQPAGAGSEAVPVTERLSALAPNTLVHYRVVAENAAGVVSGGDQTLRTGPAIAIKGLPEKGCTNRRRLTVRVKATSADALTGTTVKLDGKKVAAGKKPRLRVRLRPRKLDAGKHTLAVASSTATSRATKKARFRTCG